MEALRPSRPRTPKPLNWATKKVRERVGRVCRTGDRVCRNRAGHSAFVTYVAVASTPVSVTERSALDRSKRGSKQCGGFGKRARRT